MTDDRRPAAAEPVDPDAAATDPDERAVLLAVMLGGIAGAVARYETGLRWPTAAAGFPWTTFAINLIGSLLLPIVVVLALDVWPKRRLLRPLLGTGVIGGFTTFSTFAVDQQRLFSHGHTGTAVAYIALTLAGCTTATWAATRGARALVVAGRS